MQAFFNLMFAIFNTFFCLEMDLLVKIGTMILLPNSFYSWSFNILYYLTRWTDICGFFVCFLNVNYAQGIVLVICLRLLLHWLIIARFLRNWTILIHCKGVPATTKPWMTLLVLLLISSLQPIRCGHGQLYTGGGGAEQYKRESSSVKGNHQNIFYSVYITMFTLNHSWVLRLALLFWEDCETSTPFFFFFSRSGWSLVIAHIMIFLATCILLERFCLHLVLEIQQCWRGNLWAEFLS